MEDPARNFRSSRDPEDRLREQLARKGVCRSTIIQFRRIILDYYHDNGRDLPWRHTTDPYHILVSEIMLQQTQVGRVAKKYPEFLKEFPTVPALAAAPLPRLLAVWQGMGYNRRVLLLQACARRIQEEYSGIIPGDESVLSSLPGIGRATAGSIMAFAFNEPSVFIETNIRRVFLHFFFEGRDQISDDEIRPVVQQALDRKDPRTWYSALMDYGTMLKSSVPNPNRRSDYYRKQPAFKGSDRELRGKILMQLSKNSALTEGDIAQDTCGDTFRVTRVLRDLEKEGFLDRKNGWIHIHE